MLPSVIILPDVTITHCIRSSIEWDFVVGNRNASTCPIAARPSSHKVIVYSTTVDTCPAACTVSRITFGDAFERSRLMTPDRLFDGDVLFVTSFVIATCLYLVKRFVVKRHRRVSPTHRNAVFKSTRDEAPRIDEFFDSHKGEPMHQQKQTLDEEENNELVPPTAEQGGNTDMATSESPVDDQCTSSDFSLSNDASDETSEPSLLSAGNTSVDSDSSDSLTGSLQDLTQLPLLISPENQIAADNVVISLQDDGAETAKGVDRELIDCLSKTAVGNNSADTADSANMENSPSLADVWYDLSELDCPTVEVNQAESTLDVSTSSVAGPADDAASVPVAILSSSSYNDSDLASTTLEDEEDIPWNVSLDGYKPGFDFAAAAKSSGLSLNVVEVPTVEPPRRRTRRGGRRARNRAERNAATADN